MIQFLVIAMGLVVLASIFTRRYLIAELGRGKNLLDMLHFHNFHKAPQIVEFTVDEMIPEASTVDAKKALKATIMMKKADIDLAKNDQLYAEKHLIQALALDPSNVDTYVKLALLYLHQGQFGKAENLYQKLISSNQNDPVFFSNLAVALYQQKKLPEAKTNYLKAIELDSSRAGRFFSLAQVLKELGEMQEALTHFKKAIEMDPKNIDYMLSLAQVYIDAGLMDDARDLLKGILAVEPGNEIAMEMMAKTP